MSDTRTIRPAPGRRVRHPAPPHRLLKADGETVTWGSYWQRLLGDEDVEIVPEAPPAKSPAAAAKTES